jgi:hypothetical protein
VSLLTPHSVRWLARIAVVLAVPVIPCCAYYTLAEHGDVAGLWPLTVILAVPVALLGFIGLVMGLLEPRASKLKLWLAGIALVAPAVFLLWIRI